MEHKAYLKLAVEEALEGMRSGDGGPFGAVIVRDGEIIGKGHNTVLKSHDPTAHAEINAIRNACSLLKNYHLSGAIIYTNFEPCPMCLAAIYWADIRSVLFSADRETAEEIGFMDKHLYDEISMPLESREMKTTQFFIKEMEDLLREWKGMEGKILY